jgi:site-specific recombinase XerD
MSIRPYKKRNDELIPGVWEIDFRPEGRNGPRRVLKYPEDGVCSRVEAEAFEKECRRLTITSQTKKHINPSIESILPEYLEWHSLHRAAKTHKDVLASLPKITKIFGSLPVSRITPGDVVRFSLLRPTHPRATNKDLHYLGGIISWMVTVGYADPLPFKPEQMPYTKPLPDPPTADEVEAFLAQIKEPDKKALCIMMFEAGTRWNETANMRWEKVALKDGTAKVLGKGNKWRLVLLPERVVEILTPLQQPSGWVFPNPKTGEPYGSFKTLFKAACRRAGIRSIHPHELRHRAATDTLEACGDLMLVKEMLGHSSIQTTTIYTQVVSGRLKAAAEKVAYLRGRQ